MPAPAHMRQVEALIAHGGFSSVYAGLWQGLEVAIKVRCAARQVF